MNHLWYISSLYFDRIPVQMPFVKRNNGDHIIILPAVNAQPVFLTKKAEFILKSCDGVRNVKDIVRDYMLEFMCIERNIASYTVVSLVRRLERFGLLHLKIIENV